LNLEPSNDPAESLFDWIEDQTLLKEKTESENEEIKQLSSKLKAARADLTDKKQTLQTMEQTVKELGKKSESARAPTLNDDARMDDLDTADHQEREKTLERLRAQVTNLKAEIGEQQQQRSHLRKMLEDEHKKRLALSSQNEPAKQVGAAEESVTITPSGKHTLPEYTDAFRKSCESLPSALTAKAILAVGRFAAHENEIWRQTKPIKRLPEHYRIRVNIDYRMLVHWQPGKSLRILDLIPRQDLDSWIKRHG
jgi:hypothetical protein